MQGTVGDTAGRCRGQVPRHAPGRSRRRGSEQRRAVPVSAFIGWVVVALLLTGCDSGASELLAQATLERLAPDREWIVRGSWSMFPRAKGHEVAVQAADDPLLHVTFAVDPGAGCPPGSACEAAALAALDRAKILAPEFALIESMAAACRLPIFALHRFARFTDSQGEPVLQGSIDLERSLEAAYPETLDTIKRCVSEWAAERGEAANTVWADAPPAVSVVLLPPGKPARYVPLIGSREVSDHGDRYRAEHYRLFYHDGVFSELQLGLGWDDRTELVEAMQAALLSLLRDDPDWQSVPVGRLKGALWVSRTNLELLWVHFELCLEGRLHAGGCVGDSATARVRFDRGSGSADSLEFLPGSYNAMLFDEEDVS